MSYRTQLGLIKFIADKCGNKNNTANKITTTHSITSKFILEYNYNILKI